MILMVMVQIPKSFATHHFLSGKLLFLRIFRNYILHSNCSDKQDSSLKVKGTRSGSEAVEAFTCQEIRRAPEPGVRRPGARCDMLLQGGQEESFLSGAPVMFICSTFSTRY